MKIPMIAIVCALPFLPSWVLADPKPKVVDGDTVRTESGERVRMRNYDSPEVRKTGKHAAKCRAERLLGLQAKRELQRAIRNGTDVRLQGAGVRDSHRRELGTLTIDGRDAGDILKEKGLAKSGGGHKRDWCS